MNVVKSVKDDANFKESENQMQVLTRDAHITTQTYAREQSYFLEKGNRKSHNGKSR